jgi:hypothetical protein
MFIIFSSVQFNLMRTPNKFMARPREKRNPLNNTSSVQQETMVLYFVTYLHYENVNLVDL